MLSDITLQAAERGQGPAVFLASPVSDFVSGYILYVDGGIVAYIGNKSQNCVI